MSKKKNWRNAFKALFLTIKLFINFCHVSLQIIHQHLNFFRIAHHSFAVTMATHVYSMEIKSKLYKFFSYMCISTNIIRIVMCKKDYSLITRFFRRDFGRPSVVLNFYFRILINRRFRHWILNGINFWESIFLEMDHKGVIYIFLFIFLNYVILFLVPVIHAFRRVISHFISDFI